MTRIILLATAAAFLVPPAMAKKKVDVAFIAFGDQGTGDSNQIRVAEAMERWHKKHRARCRTPLEWDSADPLS